MSVYTYCCLHLIFMNWIKQTDAPEGLNHYYAHLCALENNSKLVIYALTCEC